MKYGIWGMKDGSMGYGVWKVVEWLNGRGQLQLSENEGRQ